MKRQVQDNDLIVEYLQSVQENRVSLLRESVTWTPARKALAKKAILFFVVQVVATVALQMNLFTGSEQSMKQALRAPASLNEVLSSDKSVAKASFASPAMDYLGLVVRDGESDIQEGE